MDFVLKSIALNHYKRKDIQMEMVREAMNKEIAISFSGKGYGKRPDALNYPNDVLTLAKKGATSFHGSEELWSNPLNIVTGASKKETEELRTGWDFIIDIDCPYWKLSKITAWLVIKVLEDFEIKSISAKFSGNKGFHIGVPFEAFPKVVNGVETKTQFPEDPRKIALYILDYISKNYINVTDDQKIIFGNKFSIPIAQLAKQTKSSINQLTKRVCKKCHALKKPFSYEFICPKCSHSLYFRNIPDTEYQKCPNTIGGEKCNTIMNAKKLDAPCKCGSEEHIILFDPLSIIEVDTLLISSRHLYRMTYSLHEKSGLVSTPINPSNVLNFSKKEAEPKDFKMPDFKFLERENVKHGEAMQLLLASRDFQPTIKQPETPKNYYEEELLDEAIPEDKFPPCIKKILEGVTDGRKRSIFILQNFLTSVGWDKANIKKRLYEWNKLNSEELRQTILDGQLRHHMQRKESILPPNCNNNAYYKDMQICLPDEFCPRIKNPAQYTKLKEKLTKKTKKKATKKSKESQTKEQK